MTSNCEIFRTKNLIHVNGVKVLRSALGDRVFYYRCCSCMRDFLSKCSLSTVYSVSDVVRIRKDDVKCLISELEDYVANESLIPSDIGYLVGFKNLLKRVSVDSGYNYYISYSK